MSYTVLEIIIVRALGVMYKLKHLTKDVLRLKLIQPLHIFFEWVSMSSVYMRCSCWLGFLYSLFV